MYWHGLPYPDRPHFTTFDYETGFTAYRDAEVFASSPEPVDIDQRSAVHRPTACCRWMAPSTSATAALVQPSFLPANGKWWTENWITETVELLIDGFARDGRAELNVDFCAAIPILTITGSFGVPDRAGTRHSRERSRDDPQKVVDMHQADRRRAPRTAARRPDQRAGAGRTHRRGRCHTPISPTARSTRSCCCCSARARGRRGSRWAPR